MADPFPNPYLSSSGHRCHPDAPLGGGGPGGFAGCGPLQALDRNVSHLPHPDSLAARQLTPQAIRAPSLHARAESVVAAYRYALRLAPAAIARETGYQLGHLVEGFIPGLLQMLAALGISTVAGAATGAAIGFFFAGVGAAPGAVIGGGLGLQIGTAILAWIGLGLLAAVIGEGLRELTTVVWVATHRAWQAPDQDDFFCRIAVDSAARDLALAVGILFRLILQGIVAYLLKKGAVASTHAAVTRGQSVAHLGAPGAANASVAEVTSLLRQSKLPDEFAVWVERNWEHLVRDPRLQPPPPVQPLRSSSASEAVTPSQLRAMRSAAGKSPSREDLFPLDSEARFRSPSAKSPSSFARDLQGTGNYPGIDTFRDITLKKGTVIFGGAPGQSNFYTTASALRRSGGKASELFQGLQVSPHPTFGYRPGVTAYEVLEDVPAAFGKTLANPQHGHGNLPQIVFKEYERILMPLYSIPLKP